jgi:hypothetical protein
MTTTYFAGRPLVPEDLADSKQHRKALARAVNSALRGQSNNSLMVTLGVSVPTTTVVDARISLQTACHLAPMTADAAAEVAAGALFVVPQAGEAVINHRNAATVDRTFIMSLHG